MRILVTGGAGFIGSNLVRRLLSSPEVDITVLDRHPAAESPSARDMSRVTFVEGDVTDATAVRTAVAGHDGIVHLAAQAGVPSSLVDPAHDCRVNVFGTLNVLEAARVCGVERVVFASSSAPLGRQEPPAAEDKVPLPLSPYGASKLAGEAYCLAYHGSWGLGSVALRFSNVYGELSAHKKSVVARFFRDAHTTGRIVIDGGGTQTRDFIYVQDVCEAIVTALQSKIGGEVFQIGTGVETSIIELATLVREITACGAEIVEAPARSGDVGRSYSSCDKARSMLGWEPVTSLRDGLQATWSWIRDHEEALAPSSEQD